MLTMKTIGIFTSGYGHESIAEAIAEDIRHFAKNKYKIKTFKQELILDFAYSSLYRLNPSALGPPFRVVSNLLKTDKKLKKIVESLFLANNERQIKTFVKKHKINLATSTYFVYNPALEKIQAKFKIPLINVFTDPKTIHPLAVPELAQSNLVFDDKSEVNSSAHPLKPAGWFVRERFEEDYDQQDVRRQLQIANRLTILIVSGSEGANAVLKILPSIINCTKPVNFIIACGNNKFLYNNILGIKQSLEKLSSSQAVLQPLGFTKELHRYMQAADLVIGKAGPNTLFESVATLTPFFAITHIHGQEDGNLEIIKDYQLGFVEENASKANRKLTAILKKPEQLAKFQPHLLKLKKYNQGAGKILLEEIERLLAPSAK